MPILSICIPTYNRSSYLDNTLSQITSDDYFKNSDDVEIVISNNCSTDNTEDICRKFQKKYGDKILYFRQPENINDKNFAFVLGLARGKYAKLNNDNLFFMPGELKPFVDFLKSNETQDIIFFPNDNTKKGIPYTCNTFNDLLDEISFMITWIGGFCVKTDAYKKLDNPDRYSHLNFSQVDIIARMMSHGSKANVYPKHVLDSILINKKGGYNIPEIFGRNYLTIIDEIYNQKLITPKVYNKHKKQLLLKHINKYCFKQKGTFFYYNNYFRILFPYYWSKWYFYSSVLKYGFKKYFKHIFSITKNSQGRKKIKFLFIKINLPKKKQKQSLSADIAGTPQALKGYIYNSYGDMIYGPLDKIEIGRYTYGSIHTLMNANRAEKLIIGDFCSIGENVHFIVSSEHNYKCLSTYPFKVRVMGETAEAESKGNIVVKDDVWIGFGAIICSGVTIGQGAIVAAGAIVTKDVPPYAIVGGNPAKVIKYRFSAPIISKLLKFDFSRLTEDKIKNMQGALYKDITEDNVDDLLKDFQ